jgi:hypothetical protein
MEGIPGEEPGELLFALEVVVEIVFVFAVNTAPFEILVEGKFVFLVKSIGIGKTGKPVMEIGYDFPTTGEIEIDDMGRTAIGRTALPGGRTPAINR